VTPMQCPAEDTDVRVPVPRTVFQGSAPIDLREQRGSSPLVSSRRSLSVHASRWTVSGEKAGVHTAMYSAPSGVL
jgi:hypothetical protein